MASYWFFIGGKVGFSVGDLKESKEKTLTEYVLIEMLLSFGIALMTGVVYSFVGG